MITAGFKISGNRIIGLTISGHSDYSEEGSDIVCAAVSSAVIMTVNTVTEILRINAEADVDDGFLELNLSKSEADAASVVLDGLRLHLTALAQDYKNYIKVKISEV